MIERYRVYWVELDPVVGSEMSKTRPAVVISDDGMNRSLQTVVVCPVTSRLHPRWPSRVQTHVAGRPVEIAVDQIHTVSRERLRDEIGAIDDDTAATVRHVITQMYGLRSVSSTDE
ncbi:MAG: type II toxin-antitoxin system PemK/MazF family toxin [Spirochaetota bacterium]